MATLYGRRWSQGAQSVSSNRGPIVQITKTSRHVISVPQVKSLFVVVAVGRDEFDRGMLNMTVAAGSMHARFSLL